MTNARRGGGDSFIMLHRATPTIAHHVPIAHIVFIAPIAHIMFIAPIAHIMFIAHIAHIMFIAHIALMWRIAPIRRIARGSGRLSSFRRRRWGM
jgi:hypothetical protein